uniref:RING-type E3 ubiquitin transferase n=1 Tax=Manihot esculenta TaxID=3983 RepID=A0A2C9VV46_MANES
MATRDSETSRESMSQGEDDTVYVALGKDVEQQKLTLLWALENFPGKKFCILHVHQPSKTIPCVGGNFLANRVDQQELKEFQELERKIMHRILEYYLLLCHQVEVQAEKLCIEMDDTGKGIVELAYQHGIKKLVMGAAADKRYSEDMADLKSRKAKYVQQRIPLCCQVWYVCKGYLVHTGEGELTCSSANALGHHDSASSERIDETGLELELCEVPQSEEDIHLHNPDALESSTNQLYEQLEQALMEAEKFKREAFEESLKHWEAEKIAIKAIRRAKALESLYAKELKLRKESEEALVKEKEDHQRTKKQWDEDRLITMDQRLLQQIQSSNFDNKIKEMNDEILTAVEQCKEYKKERDELELERDIVLKIAEEISKFQAGDLEIDIALKIAEELSKRQAEDASAIHMGQFLSVFSLSEIKEATRNFDPSFKIGEGGYGSIYKGVLRYTPVAIKVLNPDSMQGPLEFKQEVEMLSKLRHPNLVILIGACLEAFALIYEYLPNGSLEDRLSCKDNSSPLPWQARIRIATELCSVLIFLHSSNPHSIVHGDLKPGNILLDAKLACKLSDFGICRALSLQENSRNRTLYHKTDPKGTFLYLDPYFLATGELSPKSDTYSFGVILLQLLTGRSAFGIVKQIGDALDEGTLSSFLDPLAGDWPFVQAKQLARLALRCCSMNRNSRPDLAIEAWRVLEPMRASCGDSSSLQFSSLWRQQSPSYFLCPILQEMMRDPHVAADGFTYEAEALIGWLESGHNTSPMTNLELQHFNLVPNHSLRSAIQEWQQFSRSS